jgi:hypothetical protein
VTGTSARVSIRGMLGSLLVVPGGEVRGAVRLPWSSLKSTKPIEIVE